MTGNLLVFAVPFLLANLVQAMYSAVDLWVVGKFGGGKIGVAAVSNGGEVMHLVMSFIMGLTTGATVLIGRYFGAGDKRNTSRCIGMVMSFSLLMSVFMTAGLVLLAPLLVSALHVPDEAVKETIQYISICSWGVVFIIGYNALAAIFRGFGNSVAPLIFVGVACLCNIAGDVLLVAKWNMGVRGAAYATIISQALSMLLALFFLWKGRFGFKFALPNFRINLKLVWQYLKIGIPIGLQSILIGLSFLFIVSIVNAMGGADSAPAAGYGIVNRINGFAMLPAMSFAMALSALTAQNMGANKPERVKKGTIATLVMVLIWSLTVDALILPFREPLASLFSDTPDVIRVCGQYVGTLLPFYPFFGTMFCLNSIMRGAGESLVPMMIAFVAQILCRVPAVYLMAHFFGPDLMFLGFPAGWVVGAILASLYYRGGKWKRHGSLAAK